MVIERENLSEKKHEREREYIRPWLGLRLNVEINVTSNPSLAYSRNGATALLLSAAHTYTLLSPSRSRTISFMVTQSL